MKKLYLLTQSKVRGHDTYDSCVVCADSEENAKLISPGIADDSYPSLDPSWPKNANDITAQEIGIANDSVELNDIIVASFNAG